MWITRDIAVRTLIWLVAFTLPVQAACDCASGRASGQAADTCCPMRQVRSCCARRPARTADSCCSKTGSGQDSACKCEFNCRCGKSKRQEPAMPMVHNSQTAKVASNSLTTASVATVNLAQSTRRREQGASNRNAATALDRCTYLCRFTL